MTIKITDLKPENINFEEVKLGNKNTFVKPTYDHDDFPHLQFPWLTFSSFGVPPKRQYTQEDRQRNVYSSSDCNRRLIQSTDENDKMRNNIVTLSNLHIFGSSLVNEYQPLVKYDEKHNKAYIKVK